MCHVLTDDRGSGLERFTQSIFIGHIPIADRPKTLRCTHTQQRRVTDIDEPAAGGASEVSSEPLFGERDFDWTQIIQFSGV